MARFDVHRLEDGLLVLDCQNELLDEIGTRLVVPLMPEEAAPPLNKQLNPAFHIAGEEVIMVTQPAATIRTRELHLRVGSLAAQRDRIVRAIDVLIGAA